MIAAAALALAALAPSADAPTSCEANFAYLSDPVAFCGSEHAQILADAKPALEPLINPPSVPEVQGFLDPTPGGYAAGDLVDGIPLPVDVADAIVEHFPEERQGEAVRVARCESGFDPEARNPRSSATGLWQFINRTHRWVSSFIGAFDRTDVWESTEAAAWLVDYTVRVERRSPFAHWECRSAIR